eukprot:TRINITY_DN2162_c0_g1_i1.p1 TRINITY_DN2162_c0_g1~~TRINITY_DN2162_c0_g1_i1.p1  ORF type:complete len:241 (-),score=42.21 TRINITY_DN2162_c0_g1_i1:40-762(-)
MNQLKKLIEGENEWKERLFMKTCDIRDSQSVSEFVKGTLDKFGKIDVLINNAGGQFPVLAEYLNEKGFTAVVRNNLIGTWIMTSTVAKLAFIPRFEKRTERENEIASDENPTKSAECNGRVINIIAQIARGFPGMVHTGAARAGVDNITKTLSVEWAKYNIKINAVAPGVVASTGTTRYPPETLVKSRNATPLRRLATCEEIANLCTFLSSEEAASFITGQTYYIDGGQSLHGDMFDSKL